MPPPREEPMVSWAQNGEDIVLWRAVGDVVGGRYVDVGAADPEHDSVTKLLYDRGWSGINVEPVKEFADRLKSERKRDLTVQVCAGAEAATGTFYRVDGSGLSSLDDAVIERASQAGFQSVEEAVEVTTLNEILNGAGFGGQDIHVLKIDVEGFEREVILGLDREIWRPWIIVVEATEPNSTIQVQSEWEPDLVASGYEFCLFDGLNRFYVAQEHADRKPMLSYPACALDPPFISAPHRHALLAYDELAESARRLDEELQSSLISYHKQEEALREQELAYERQESALSDQQSAYRLQQTVLLEQQAAYHNQENALHEQNAAYRRQQQEMSDLRTALTESSEAQQALSGECSTLRAGIVQMAAELDELRESNRIALADALQKLVDVHSSSSWRLTEPIRGVVDPVKRALRNKGLSSF